MRSRVRLVHRASGLVVSLRSLLVGFVARVPARVQTKLLVAFLAMVCTRFRDITLIVRNLMQAIFLLTPVFWDFELIEGKHRLLVELNPFFHMIQVVRMPLLGELPTLTNYLVVIGMIGGGSLAVMYVYRRMRRNLAFYM